MVETFLAFALYLATKIDASRFSGPEHFSLGLRCYRIENRFFDADSTDADASIDRGAQKRLKIP